MPSLAFIHTVADLAGRFRPLAAELLPGWTSFPIVDESLLGNTIRDGALSPKTVQRLTGYVFSAVDAGADAIVVTCSTLGGAVDRIIPLSPVPLFRIDRGMAETAVRRATRIGVLATLPTTLAPTAALLRACAGEAERNCEIVEHLCVGAFERLSQGNRAAHDAAVVAGFETLSGSGVELVVLAQASMAGALSTLEPGRGVPFLTSPELGMAHVAARLTAA